MTTSIGRNGTGLGCPTGRAERLAYTGSDCDEIAATVFSPRRMLDPPAGWRSRSRPGGAVVNSFLTRAELFLGNVGWRDVVDLAVVAVLLYQLFKLIRGTQAVQLLVGLAVLFIIAVAAQVLHLRLLEFIFANAGQAILIAVVVLFQPELRRALDRFGRLGAMRGLVHHSPVALLRVVDEVMRAAATLSERRTGALIVFERSTGLENVAASGVRINADITAELLTSLFYPNSPLHDGAVLIHGDSISAAGCVLPLADALPGVGRLGTRHRAALGLTLQSDAVILIVSEETGLISIASEGKLLRGLDHDKLRETLTRLLGAQAMEHSPRGVVGPLVRRSAVRVLHRRSPQ